MIQMLTCEKCATEAATPFEAYRFDELTSAREEQSFTLCNRCARAQRRVGRITSEPYAGLTRAELIDQLDKFFLASGVFDICGRCHQQGTGCCPPTCRVLGTKGCDSTSKYGKSVFCSIFICGALLNAIADCDAVIARKLKWLKREVGPVEFRIYEMLSRTPSSDRDSARVLSLPSRYPHLAELEDGAKLKQRLLSLADEVLEIRREWRKEEVNGIGCGLTTSKCKGK